MRKSDQEHDQRSLDKRSDYENVWKTNRGKFEARRTIKERDTFLPSEMEKSDKHSPSYSIPLNHESPRSMVYQTLEEKTEAFLHRQRERQKAHNLLMRKDHPVGARV